MKTRIITSSALSYLIAMMGILPVQAQSESELHSVTLTDSITHPIISINEKGTAPLQEKVLMQINEGLVNGSLSIEDASQFKDQLNKLNEKESWYKSLNSPIPSSVTEKSTMLLTELSQKLQQRKPQLLARTDSALHADIDELVSKGLTHDHISSGEAEAYYLRLAQIESSLESSKRNPAPLSDQSSELNKNLHELKSELTHKVNQVLIRTSDKR